MDTTHDDLTRAAVIRRIRAALKRRSGKDWSVTGGRGTGYGWLTIDAPPMRRTWQWMQVKGTDRPSPAAVYGGAVGITPHYRVGPMAEDPITEATDDPWVNEALAAGREVWTAWEVRDPDRKFGHMAPPERAELAKLLGMDRPVHYQGQSIPSGHDHYREWIDRAEGRTPREYGRRDWD
jgi:hypothetical protein